MRSDNRLEESYIFESLNSLARPALISARGGIVSRYRPPPHAAGKMLLKLFAQCGGLLYNIYIVACRRAPAATFVAARAPAGCSYGRACACGRGLRQQIVSFEG